MLVQLPSEENYSWLAPYGYAIVALGFLLFFYRLFEAGYANFYNRPLFRHYLVFRKLTASQLAILNKDFSFYKSLSKKFKRQFQHRVATFLTDKEFIGRNGLIVTEEMKVLIAATACMLSFGRKNFEYGLISVILIYPDEFYSKINNAYHKGEFNPGMRALVLSWKDFKLGFEDSHDNRNLGIHEFMHAMQLEAKQSRDTDSMRLSKQFQNILHILTDPTVREKLDKTNYFRRYAFTNQYEFLAVLTEFFIESPSDFKANFPSLYSTTKKLLNFRFSGYE